MTWAQVTKHTSLIGTGLALLSILWNAAQMASDIKSNHAANSRDNQVQDWRLDKLETTSDADHDLLTGMSRDLKTVADEVRESRRKEDKR